MAKWIGHHNGTASAPNTRKGRKSERAWIARLSGDDTIKHIVDELRRDLDAVDKRKRRSAMGEK